MYAIIPGVATLGVAGLLAIFAAHALARRRQADPVSAGLGLAMAAGGMAWAASETAKPRLVVTRFGAESPNRPATRPDENVAVRLDRLRQALDQLTGLLLIGTSGDDGQARFLASLGGDGGRVERQVAASAVCMRRLGTLMLSTGGGDAFLVARSATPVSTGEGRDARAIWSDFLAALAFLTGACQRRSSTIHLGEVEATALAIEDLCLSLVKTERLQHLLATGLEPEGR
ncbi:MAG: hypothetical protein V4820_03455 [Pseudomonadota bacterium]